ncbi:variant erythrocyte surface antigen-1 family protein [Babesia divergens]|uniref:Variant erythrocyte surface antigen-1 family protein n=1 Tax=Babesia divergens TaxID=32595 RepID=A0AAD9GBC6_BABDI|nr:variant erythrocyte surface antigen-1 family protein [Babesia divergens]
MCSGGEALPSSLSVLRTLRSVLTGSLGPLRGTRKVCSMYYTDVFVGSNDIDKLKNALKAELKGSGLTVDLKELEDLASGLGRFIGYDSSELTGKGIGKNGHYASSYKDASWPECGSKPCPSCSSCSHSGSSTSCNGSCCPDCDVKKAAKIFLGFLPCLYYALKYLYDRCNGEWSGHNINHKDYSLSRFLVGMGYDLQKLNDSNKGSDIFGFLNTLFKDSPGPLQSLYEKSKKYFTSFSHSISSGSQDPLTVRDILLWLSGLPFSKGFEALLKHCKGLCDSTGNSVKFDNFETSLFNSCFLSPFVLAAIQWPGKSEIFYHNFSDISDSLYPEDPFDLFNMLFDYVRKIFAPLKFLEYQCKTDKNSAGWQDCGFGKSCMEALESSSGSPAASTKSPCCQSSSPYGIVCTGKRNDKDHAEHCISSKPEVKCMGLKDCDNSPEVQAHASTDAHQSGKCTPCPHPLVRFLTDSWPFLRNSPDSSVPPMGFSKENLPSPGRRGEALHTALKDFCDSSSSPLTRLVQYSLCISRTPPETLGEFFSFFQKFVPKLNSKFVDFENYVSKEPGQYSGQKFTTAFQTALETLNGSSHSGNSHPYDLKSLYDCHAAIGSGASCAAYLNLLTGDVYDIFVDDFLGTYLSFVCHVPRMFREKVEEFRKKFSDCCSSGSCKTIIYCPCAWPLISSQGFSFTSRGSLSGKKSCSNFIDQLDSVLASGSPLGLLINAIDAFLWSIREPFFFFVLAFWAFVISYFLYVQLYKLDLLHLKSHAHLPRSFKILPSTLFSDASSRLKDLSYFTL